MEQQHLMLDAFIEDNKLGQGFHALAQKWFIPLANKINAHHDGAKRTIVIGVNGSQGSGKSTLSLFLKSYLEKTHNKSVINLSLDDFYLTRSERIALSVKVHPLFQTRGVPGTHDMVMAADTIQALSQSNELVSIPRFDKAIDDRAPADQWPEIDAPIDIIIFEGWCWGAHPQSSAELNAPVNEFEKNEDPVGIWRQYVNQQLTHAYLPLYEKVDKWLMLKAPSFDVVYKWRLEQETKLAQSYQGEGEAIMSPEQVASFIAYYQRLTEHCLHTLPDSFDWVFELDTERKVTNLVERS